MTDEQIIEKVKDIINHLHNPKTGFGALSRRVRSFLRANGLDDEQINKRWQQVLMPRRLTMIAKTHGIPEDAFFDEKLFSVTGKDVLENRFERSCGHKAKAFAYLAHGTGLDVKILVSTRATNLIDGMACHTVPCVKLSDGKYHAFDPALPLSEFKFIDGKIEEGEIIYHLLEPMKGEPYKIRCIMEPDVYEKEFSVFKNAMGYFVERSKKTEFTIGKIQAILNKIVNPRKKSSYLAIYEFLTLMRQDELDIGVVEFMSDGNRFPRLRIQLENDVYLVSIGREYVMLHKQSEMLDDGYKIVGEMSPNEYIQFYNTVITKHITNKQND